MRAGAKDGRRLCDTHVNQLLNAAQGKKCVVNQCSHEAVYQVVGVETENLIDGGTMGLINLNAGQPRLVLCDEHYDEMEVQ
jgi:hypothetical protein